MGHIVRGAKHDWEVVIGLEIHAQIESASKLFSRSSTAFGAEPNTQVSMVDAAMPGTLPTLNEKCVEQAVKTGLGINGQINLTSVFDRKNYFYPDLPQGYQISQFRHPIVGRGHVDLYMPDGDHRVIGITRIHMEQDAGKSLHDQSPTKTFVDLNRSGIALMEIVSEPDMRSSDEAVEYVKKLRSILRYLGTCDGDMEKGSLRCDANVSVRIAGSKAYGTRCEIKNLNSTKSLARAIEYEVVRQIDLLESGEEVKQETRAFDITTGKTRSLRSKEDAADYRYFPDPDLPPLVLTQEYVDHIRSQLPELPDQKISRYVAIGLSVYDANVLVAEKENAVFFEEVAKSVDPKLAASWVTVELFGRLNKEGVSINASPITAERLAGLLSLIANETISGKIAKQVFDIMWQEPLSASEIVEKHQLRQVTNSSEIEKIVTQVIAENQDKVSEYKAGKDKLFGFFVGQVMKLSAGKANPNIVNELLVKHLQ